MIDELKLNRDVEELYSARRFREGIKLFDDYIRIHGGASVRTYLNYALLLHAAGEFESELVLYKRLEAAGVDDHDFYVNYATALNDAEEFALAAEMASRALKLDESSGAANEAFGNARANEEFRREAGTAFGRIWRVRSSCAHYELVNEILGLVDVNPIPTSETSLWDYRWKFKRTMQHCIGDLPALDLSALDDVAWALSKVSRTYVSYLGENDLEINKLHSNTLRILLSRMVPDAELSINHRSRRRIGVITTARYHRKLFCEDQLREIDPNRYEVTYIVINNPSYRPPSDAAVKYIHFSPKNIQNSIKEIRSLALDFAYFPEIGMSIECQFLSNTRLASETFTSWLHPITSGSDYVDRFITSALMEPAIHHLHYHEKTYLCPDLALKIPDGWLGEADELKRKASQRTSFNLICLQNPIKILPKDDEFLLKLLIRFPNTQLHFVEGPIRELNRRYRERLLLKSRAFNFNALIGERVHFHPRMNKVKLKSLLEEADLAIDVPGWSGGNTTFDCISANLPVLAFAGRSLRARHTLGIYSAIKSTRLSKTLVCSDAEDALDRLEILLDSLVLTELKREISLNKKDLYLCESGVKRYISDFFG